jgi:hypothetical protein
MELIRIPNLLQHYYYRQTQTRSLGPRVSKQKKKKKHFSNREKGHKIFFWQNKKQEKILCIPYNTSWYQAINEISI